jgi:hypothetical protein
MDMPAAVLTLVKKKQRIFVFGANAQGIHGRGSALTAREKYGAILGVGHGPQGQSYGIVTKYSPYRCLSLDVVATCISDFLLYAKRHPELTFHVVRVGCNLAGFKDEQIAPLFKDAPVNCEFDPAWAPYGLQTWKESM